MRKLKTKAKRRDVIFLKLYRELVATNISVQSLKGTALSELRLMGALRGGDQRGNWDMPRPQSNLVERAL